MGVRSSMHHQIVMKRSSIDRSSSRVHMRYDYIFPLEYSFTMSSRSEVLVTGGCGFIGRHLVKDLLAHEYNVTVLDKSDSGMASFKNVKLVRGDVLDMDAVRTALGDARFVIHLAALIDADDSTRNPLPYMATNILGTKNVLHACAECDSVEKFVLASTAAVYGHGKRMPICEDDELAPISPYGQSKVVAEEHVRDFQRETGVNAIILRLFNVYGAGQNDRTNSYSGVITRFLEDLYNKRDLKIFGDGSQTRDFFNIADAVNAFRLALERSNVSGTFNIGTGLAISISQLANKILELQKITNKSEKLKIHFLPERAGDIRHSCPDISRASSVLGYTSTITLDRGLEELYRHGTAPVAPSIPQT